MAYKQECSSLRAQLAAALVQGEVVRDNREVSPHLEQTVTELTAKLRSLEESWREEREKLLEENKRLEAVGQQRWDMGRGTGGWGHRHGAWHWRVGPQACRRAHFFKLPVCCRSQELQVAVQQVRQLERELDAVKKELAGTQKQLQVWCGYAILSHTHTHALQCSSTISVCVLCQVALKDGEQEVSCELRGSCATPSANPGTSGKTRHK